MDDSSEHCTVNVENLASLATFFVWCTVDSRNLPWVVSIDVEVVVVVG